MRRSGSALGTGVAVILILVVVLIVAFGFGRGFFVGEDVAVRALDTQGYSNIQITGKNWFVPGLRGCDAKDAVAFTATATNPKDKKVEVIVCAGWLFKGATVRTK